ncbi:MAG: efflux RND transporter periplasmic adaptor subunit [Terriglobia bacterium]
MTSRKKKALASLIIAAVVVVCGVAVWWWSARGIVTVQAGQVAREQLTAAVTASGQIEPENYANVNADSMGRITDIYVKEGDRVKKGQLLLKTEDIQQQADVDAQDAALATSQADLQATQAAVQSAAAAVKTSQADLNQAKYQLTQKTLTYKRGLELFKVSLIAKQDFDQRLSDYRVAQSSVQSAAARLQQSKAQYRQAKFNADMSTSQVKQNQAALVRAKDAQSKTVYTSPYNGVVTSLPVHAGENVVPGVQNETGSLLFQVSDLSVIDAEVQVDETDIASIRIGQPAFVSIDALPNQSFDGEVTEIGQSALSSTTGENTTASLQNSNTSDQEAKQFKVVVRLKHPPAILRPGLSATARIITAVAKNAVSVPIQALTLRSRQELQKAFKDAPGNAMAADLRPANSETSGLDPNSGEIQGVFMVRNGKAVFVPVETGIMGAMNVQVTQGLDAGQEIVTGSYSVLRTLRSGARIRIDNTNPQPGGNASSGY